MAVRSELTQTQREDSNVPQIELLTRSPLGLQVLQMRYEHSRTAFSPVSNVVESSDVMAAKLEDFVRSRRR